MSESSFSALEMAKAATYATRERPPHEHPDLLRQIGSTAFAATFDLTEWQPNADALRDITIRKKLMDNYEALQPQLENAERHEIGEGLQSIAELVVINDVKYVARKTRPALREYSAYSTDYRAVLLGRHDIDRLEKTVAYSLSDEEVYTTYISGEPMKNIPHLLGDMDSTAHLTKMVGIIKQMQEHNLSLEDHENIFFDPQLGFGVIDPREDARPLASQLRSFATAVTKASQPETIQIIEDCITSAIGAAKAISVLKRLQRIIKKDTDFDIESSEQIELHVGELKDLIRHYQENGAIAPYPISDPEEISALRALAELLEELED